ncbi:MAG: hypothetical protein HQK83_05565 [Fibrobacteria bacterium]|nr:hypothetical protein [Fibrobacteria bacterium]
MFTIPAKNTTMIGSMPYATAEEALAAMDKHPLSIPAWPQLPPRSFKEGMLVQYGEGLPGMRADDAEKKVWVERNDALLNDMSSFYEDVVNGNLERFALSEDFAGSFSAFVKKMEVQKPEIMKCQVVGPFSLGLGIKDSNDKAPWFDDQYHDILLKGLTAKARWQVQSYKHITDNVISFFDEPILSALGTAAYVSISDDVVINDLNEMAGELHNDGALVGVHCCGNMDWGLLARSDIDIISFDAYTFGEKVALYPEDVQAFIEKGGYLAWGIVPTGDAESIQSVSEDILKTKMDELYAHYKAKGIDEDKLRVQSIFTPACGMGNLTEDEADKVMTLLEAMGK